jgi:hypothetical protein
MRTERNSATRTLLFIGMLGLFTVLFTPTINAEPLKPIPGEFTVVLQDIDQNTGELIFEGYKTGPLSGYLTSRVALIRQTGVALHLATRWTLMTDWGETIEGENTSVLNPSSLHFREHGIIVNATGSLTERIGNFVVIHGEVSDVYFIPGVTKAKAHVRYVPSQAKK